MTRIAHGMDVCVRTLLGALENVTKELATGERAVEVLFLDASDEALLRRFNETRRPHPLATLNENTSMAVLDGIPMERQRLAPLRPLARPLLGTNRLSGHDLHPSTARHLCP